ncbi:MAG: 3-deoxy-manno-octulosonate cytidylyltransferase [Candidatus Tectimicrobiota bacterium]|nr:MAG: 3-deoxy-manno-octulosonate cytidylyltransferase [Candidatus Tectomicrobia bacterium]
MRCLVVIPARYGSSRFPGKPLARLAGRPMIQHVYERAQQARLVDRVLVATDDRRIVAAVEAFGGQAILTSPAHPSGTDRIAEVVAQLPCEVVVNVQGDEPCIAPPAIDALIKPLLADPALAMTTLAHPLRSPEELLTPHVVKVVVDLASNALYFSRAPIPYHREAWPQAPHLLPAVAVPPGCYRHVGLYAYRRDCLLRLAQLPQTPLERVEALEQLRALEHGYRIRVVIGEFASIGVDTPEDLARAERLLASQTVSAGEGLSL